MTTATYPTGTVLPAGAASLLTATEPILRYTDPTGTFKWRLLGGEAPWPGVQDGIVCTEWPKGLLAPFKHLDLQAAQQDGVTWTATVYDPAEITMPLMAFAQTPQGVSRVASDWIASWNPVNSTVDPTQPLGTLEYITLDRGYWYCNPRLSKVWQDQITVSPRLHYKQKITHACRIDNAFWSSIPSTSAFQPGGSGTGFIRLTNIGDQPAWPAYLCYAGASSGATFGIGNGPNSSSMITLGPLEAGQIVLVTSNPRLRSVVDLSPTAVPTNLQLPGLQGLLVELIDLVTNNNVPPLLQWFESLLGIAPPQGNLYAELTGRFTTPVPGVPQPWMATENHIPVSISGGNSGSKIVASLTPQRRFCE